MLLFFEDQCTVEEAESFVEWLKSTKDPQINLENLEYMHTALVQSILYFKPEISAMPGDDFYKDLITEYLSNNTG